MAKKLLMKHFGLSSKVFGWATTVAALAAILGIFWQTRDIAMGIYGVILLSPAWLGFAGASGFVAAVLHRLVNPAPANRSITPPESDGNDAITPPPEGNGLSRLFITAILSCCISTVVTLVMQNHHSQLFQYLSSVLAGVFMLWALIWVLSFGFVFVVLVVARKLARRGANPT